MLVIVFTSLRKSVSTKELLSLRERKVRNCSTKDICFIPEIVNDSIIGFSIKSIFKVLF